jgi:hypothetical protein
MEMKKLQLEMLQMDGSRSDIMFHMNKSGYFVDAMVSHAKKRVRL